MMKFIEKIKNKINDNYQSSGVTVAFLGDSVTQGCFEVYIKSEKEMETIFDTTSAYHKYFADIFSVLCPNVPVSIINAGISGGSVLHALERLERDVICHNPDLVVVCFGLNDSCAVGEEKLEQYAEGLREIFSKIISSGAEVIFMTPNMKCTELSCHLTDDLIIDVAKANVKNQCDGIMDKYMDAAREVCTAMNVPVCDCYKKWKRLEECGINTTELLSNKINHPTREMNWLFAYSLVETVFGLD